MVEVEKKSVAGWSAKRAWRLAAACALLTGGVLACSPQGSTPDPDDERLTDQMDELIKETTSGTHSLDPVSKLEEKAFTDDPRGQAELFVTSVLNEQVAMRNEYMAELREIGWESVLDPDRLKSDEGLVETNSMLTRAKDAAQRMCAQTRPRGEAHGRAVIAQLKLSAKQRQEMLDGFIRGLDENAPTVNEICRLEVAIVDEIAGVVSVFASDPAWYPEAGSYMFSEDRYVEEFNTRLQNVQALTEKQTGLQEQAMSKASGGLRELGL